MTYFGAIDHEYEVFMLKKALLSHDADLTKAVEEITEAVTWDVVKLLLEKAR